MNFAVVSKLVDRFKNDLHVPVAIFVFVVTFTYHAISKHDLGANFTNSLYAFYGFLGGHGFTQAKWGGSNGDAKDNTADTK